MVNKTTLAFLVTLISFSSLLAQLRPLEIQHKDNTVNQITALNSECTENTFVQPTKKLILIDPPSGGFAIDGNLFSDLNGDWLKQGIGGGVLKSNGDPIDLSITQHFTDLYNSSNDNVFTQGSKSNDEPEKWNWGTKKAGDKGDIANAMYHIASDNLNNQWIIVGSDRLSNNGTSYIDFELFQKTLSATSDGKFVFTNPSTPGRNINDALLSIEYSNGGVNPVVSFSLWNGSEYVPQTTTATNAFAQTNFNSINNIPYNVFGKNYYCPFQFVEGAINLTSIFGANDPCLSVSYKSMLVKTRSSDSGPAALNDFIGPDDIEITFGSATISYDSPVCGSSSPLTVRHSGVTGGIYKISPDTPEIDIDPLSGKITYTDKAVGDFLISYSYTKNNCTILSAAEFTVTISETPGAPTTQNTTQYFCSIDNPTIANLSATGDNIKWYTSADGNAIATGALVDGTIYYATQTLGSCESVQRLAVTATVSDPDAPTTTDNSQDFCSIDLKTVGDISVSGSGIIWYDADYPNGAVVSNNTLLPMGTTTYYASQTVGSCESDTRLSVSVTVSDPAAPTTTDNSQDFCSIDLKTVGDISVSGSGIIWYDADYPNGTVVDNSTLLPMGTTTYYASQTVGGCESDTRLAVTATVSDPAAPTTTDNSQDFCSIDLKTVGDISVSGSGIIWYDADYPNGTVVDNSTLLPMGTTTYYASQTVGGCESDTRLAVTATVSDPAAPTTSDNSQDFCSIDLKTVGDISVSGSGIIWYDADYPNGAVVSNNTLLPMGTTTYYASQTVGSCESDTRLTVSVTVRDPDAPTTSDNSQDFCSIDLKTVGDISVSGSGIIWYDADYPNGAVVSNNTLLPMGTTTYYASQTVGSCESDTRLSVSVTVSDPAAPTTTDNSQDFCSIDLKTVGDISVSGSGIIWYDADYPNGTVVDNSTLLPMGTTTYYASQTVGGCESDTRLTVSVTVRDPDAPTTSDNSQDFCSIDLKTVGDISVSGSGIIWYDADYPNGAVVSNNNLLPMGTTTYYASQTVGGCESDTRLAVTATVSDPAAPTTSDNSQDFCSIDLKTVGDISVSGSGIIWYDADYPNGAVVSNNTLLPMGTTTYYASQTVGSCESDTRLSVSVTVSDPAAPTTTDNSQDFCSIDLKTVGDISVSGSGIIWYDADYPNGTVVDNSTLLPMGTTTYYASQTVGGCESDTRLAVTATVSDPAAPTTTDNSQDFCSIDLKTVGDISVSGSGIIWYDADYPNGTVVDNSTLLPMGTTTYYASQTVGGCESDTRLAVTATVSDPAAPTTSDNSQDFCSIDLKTVGDISVSGSGIIWYDADYPNGTVVDNSTLLPMGTTTYYASQTVGSCESDTRLSVSVIVNQPPIAKDDIVSTEEDTPKILGNPELVDLNDTDADGDALTIVAISNPVNGTIILNNDGTVTFTPDENFNGVASFDYTISDNVCGEDSATVEVFVGFENDPPVAVDDIVSTDEDTPITLGNTEIVEPNDTDVDGDALTIVAVSNPINGTIILNENGTVTFTPDENFNGEASFDYTISDGNGGTDSATVTVNVGLVNDPPVAVDDTVSTDEDTPITLGNTEIVDPNDTDVDGDALTIVAVSNPINGIIILNENGTVTFTPDENFNGEANFDYTISDGNGGTDTATVTVNVIPVNDPPVAVDDTVSTDEDTPITLGNTEIVDPNDTDVDGDALTIVAVSNPINGTIILNENGTVTFTPDENFNGEASFDYTISDGNGGTDSATVTVNVGLVNDPPVAVDDTVSTDEDTPITLGNTEIVDPNDTDVDGDALTIVAVSNPINGIIILNENGNVTFTPDENFNGEANFDYTISDGNGGTDTATVTVNVIPVNDAPDAVNDTVSTDEDTPITLGNTEIVDPNDTDVDGDALTIVAVSNPINGIIILNENGTVTFTPDENFNGEANFDYTISDGNGGTDTATVTVNVGLVNDPPVAVDDTVSTDEDTPITLGNTEIVDPNDTDVDGDALTIVAVSNPVNGTIILNENGTVTFTPDENFNGEANFDYTISDGNGGTDTATVTVNVIPVNDPPVAVDDTVSTDEDTPITLGNTEIVDPNDTDVDGDALTIVAVSNPVNGTIILNENGTVTFTPDENFNGEANFDYTISDGNGGTDTATVTVNVGLVNDPPVAVDDTVSTDEDTPITLGNTEIVDPNDTDVDGDALTIVAVSNPVNGTIILNENGTVTFTPDENFNGEANFDYTISDGNGGTDTATVTVNVIPVNDPPVAVDDIVSTDEDTPITLGNTEIVEPNDTDVDGDALTIVAVSNPVNGTIILNENGTVTFTPNENFNGEANFDYTISDGNGGTDTATVTINVIPVNDPPVAVDDTVSTDEDTPITLGNTEIVDPNDTDVDGDALTIVAVSNPVNGTIILNENGTVTFTPDENFNGEASFDYTISDGNGGTDSATVTITVNPINDAPVALDDEASTDEDNAVTVSVLDNDSDVDGDGLTVVSTTNPSNGTVVINNDGTITYTPDPDFNGEDSFTYTISDGNGGTDTASVTITVNAVNDAPVAVDDVATTDEDNAVTVSVLDNDSDVDGNGLTVVSTTDPSNGSVVINEDGTITYSPDANFNGEDSFTYTISDGNGGTDTATVTISVNAVNDAPIANDDVATVDEDNAVTIPVLDNDEDVDGDGLTVVSTTDPSNGTVVINNDGTITYTPDPDFNGTDSFTYTVSDGNGGTDTATVTITINPVDDQPDPPIIVEVVQPTCEIPTGTITVETIEGLTYSVNGVDYQESGVFTGLEPGTYEITAQTAGGLTSEITIVTLDELVAETIETATGITPECYNVETPYNLFQLLSGNYDDTGTWENPNSVGTLNGSLLDLRSFEGNLGTYTFNYVISGNCPSTTAVQLTIDDSCIVLNCSIDDIRDSISKAVTPNGDGFNDFFNIGIDLECGFTFDVQIFNRWGAEIYTMRNYQNNWDGFSDKSFTSSNQLPSGTYYYIIEINGASGLGPIQGYIFLGTK